MKTQEKIGIIGAMVEEVDALKANMSDMKVSEYSQMQFCEGKLSKKDVVVVQCGMGKVNAAICTNTLIHVFGCKKIINTGVAGSLNPMIDIGDIVVSIDATQHDFNAEPIGFERGVIPYTNRYAFPADEAMRKLAVEVAKEVAPNLQIFEGRVCSGDIFVATKKHKQSIVKSFEGLCCEMEGAAIAQVCYLDEIPYVIIRAISDKSDATESADFESFKAGAAANCEKIVQKMLERM